MRTLLTTAATLTMFAPLPAQVIDIGLTVETGGQPVLGQQCGPLSCSALPVGIFQRGLAQTIVHASAPVSPYALALGLPGPCVTVAGIANPLLLGAPAATLAVGLTSTPPFVPTPCNQGIAMTVLPVPRGAPAGFVVRLQSVGVSNSGALAFGPALQATVQ